MLLLKHCPDVFFPWYRNYSKQWISLLAFLFSFVPFSVWDIGALGIVLAALLMLIRTVIQRRSIGNLLRTLLPLILLGGLLYHLLFEAKSQYAMPYFLLMLPLAAYGFFRLFRKIELR